MNEHRGKVVEKTIESRGFDTEQLMTLFNLNRTGVQRLFQSPQLSWETIATIGRLIRHDFSKEFPQLATEAINNQPVIENLIAQPDNSGEGVFLVDDSEMDTLVFKITLKEAGNGKHLITFNNGDSAINKLLDISINAPEELPGHIFLDLKMPIMNGEQFLALFQRLNIDPYGKIKIHVLTSSIFYSEVQKYLVHPLITTFISKPIKLEVIKSIFG